MTSAGFGPPGSRLLDQPRGHDAETGQSVGNGPRAELPRPMSPAKLMHMNMADWAKFMRVHLRQNVNGVKLLSAGSLKKLHTADVRPNDPAGPTYGFGWVHFQTPRGEVLWHNGSNGYWYSAAALMPSKNIAVFAVTNQDVSNAVDAVLFRAAPRVT